MNRFRLIILGAAVVSGLAVALFFSATPAQAKQCSTERPSNARTYWSYRLIDGRKCWYKGRPMLSKSLLHWPEGRTAQASSRREANIVPASHFNLLDAQASISDDLEAKPKPGANSEIADAARADARATFDARWFARICKQHGGDDGRAGRHDPGSLARSRNAAAADKFDAGRTGISNKLPNFHDGGYHVHGAVGGADDHFQEDEAHTAWRWVAVAWLQ